MDAMLLRAAAAAEATAAAAADRSSYLARTVARRSPAAAERAGRDADLAREATARRLEVEAAAAEAEARRMLAEAARKREEAAEAAEAEAAAERSPRSARMEDTSRSSLDGALDVTTVSAGEIEAAMDNKETVSLLRAAGGYSKVSAGTPPPTMPGPYPTSWEDALNDILASIPQPLVSPIEKAIMSPVEDDYYVERPASASGREEAKEEEAKEEKAKEEKEKEKAKAEERAKEEEDAVTPTTGQILEISARERA